VREQIAAGKSDDEIITYMTDRYGDFVLYRPPVKATTMLLWGGPLLLLILGAFTLLRIMRERRAAPEAPPLTAEERARAEALLASPKRKDPA
jgi:cytochrome c-type biogenesis protein CcmH